MAIPYVDYLASALVNRGHAVSLWASEFAYSSDRPALDNRVELVDHFYRVSRHLARPVIARRFLKGFEHYFDMRRLAKKLRGWKPDVIHYQQPPVPLIDSFALPKLKSVAPIVITVHNPAPLHGEGGVVLRRYDRLLRQFDSAVVHTESAEVRIKQNLGDGRPVTIIRPGLYSHYRTMKDKRQTQPFHTNGRNKISFLVFGGLRNYKGIDIAIRAYAALSTELRERSSITIAGSKQSGTARARKTAAELGIAADIRWDLRFIPDAEVESLFTQSDAILMPHLDIDLSGILMVTLAMKRPFLASNVGCFKEYVVDGVHGLLSEPGDVDSLSRSMASLLNNPELRKDMAKNMGDLADSWPSWKSVADQHVGHYRKTIQST